MKKIYDKSLCVFCGSRFGRSKNFQKAAKQLGRLIAQSKARLVYGGGNLGLMGIVASSTLKNGGDVLGVIPRHLLLKEAGKMDLPNLVITDTMHDRKDRMYKESEAFIILPGGIGTLDEFFEILTWSQLDIHKKNIVLLNIDNFWDPLIKLLDHQINNGFVDPTIKNFFIVSYTPHDAIKAVLE